MLVGAPCKQGNTYDRTLLALLKILQLLPTMYFFQKEAVKIMVINKIYKKKTTRKHTRCSKKDLQSRKQ